MRRQLLLAHLFRLGAILTPLAIAQASHANPQCTYFAGRALGGQGPQITIDVSKNVDTALDFTKSGEVVKLVRLGNPRQVSVYSDGLLQSQQDNQGANGNAYATTVFFRRIDPPLDLNRFDLVETTTLFVTTESSGGGQTYRNLYEFDVRVVNGTPACSRVAIVPDTRGMATIAIDRFRHVPVDYVQMGFNVAAGKAQIADPRGLERKVVEFVRLVHAGFDVSQAAERVALHMDTVKQLAAIGAEFRDDPDNLLGQTP